MSTNESGLEPRSELTLRGCIIGVLITLIFTAANVYFGLKAGLTFATSIPAAVISMAVLRKFRNSSMQENNIVQTIASSAGCISAIIFVLPGLVIVGYWDGFPFWESAFICGLGGILGVMYSIPLRRALVTESDLPYPEGVACAEVLKVGESAREGEAADPELKAVGEKGFKAVMWGAIVSAGFYIVEQTRVFAENVTGYFHLGDRGAVSGFNFGLSFAYLAVGHLVGIWVGISMLIGTLIAWGWGVPHYAMLSDITGSASDIASAAFGNKVQLVGAGTIGIAAIWTLLKLIKPVVMGLIGAMRSARVRRSGHGNELPRTEHDIPIGYMALITLVCLVPIGWLLGDFGDSAHLDDVMWTLVIGGLVFVFLMSFFVASVCGYLAGLVGSSNSPISGVGILTVVVAALLLALGVQSRLPDAAGDSLVAFSMFISSVVFAGATIANDNLQDLKTGQLVNSTPWKQQTALVIGVLAGAVVIPVVLNVLYQVWGFSGEGSLNAPQANLIAKLSKGIINHDLDWSLIGNGILIGIAVIIVDEILGKVGTQVRFPPLAVGLGVYLPTSVTLMITVGAFVGWFFNKRADRGKAPHATKQLGVLMSSGLIVGESIMGVVIAGIIFLAGGKQHPLAIVGSGFHGASLWLGGIAFVLVAIGLYMWISRMGQSAGSGGND